ncbi:hypothetical protein L2E82_50782 [Cichorium intybus]|nr:hypothetical protein L2E82_50782 [Cichorium intybus]
MNRSNPSLTQETLVSGPRQKRKNRSNKEEPIDRRALSGELINVLREAGHNVTANLLNFGTHVKKKESKLYGAHFKEISAYAPKATKITFDSDED